MFIKKELDEIYFDDIFVGTTYEDIKNILIEYKFKSNRYYSKKLTKIYLAIYGEVVSKYREDFVIVAVPMHWSRYLIRGFDHIQLLAKDFSKNTNIPFISILWTKFSFRQAKLSREKRKKNREKNYFIKKNINTIPKNVILLDDVLSTWSSVNMCAKVLKNAWVEKIVVITLATNK